MVSRLGGSEFYVSVFRLSANSVGCCGLCGVSVALTKQGCVTSPSANNTCVARRILLWSRNFRRTDRSRHGRTDGGVLRWPCGVHNLDLSVRSDVARRPMDRKIEA